MMADKSTNTLKKFGNNLQALRLSRGLTLRDLEAESGIDNGKISKMESGETNVTIITLLKLAQALQVSPAVLLDGLSI